MSSSGSQKSGKTLGGVGLVSLVVGGCVPGYQHTPYPPCFLPDDPDPACHAPQADEGGSGDGTTSTLTSSGPFSTGSTGTGGGGEAGASSSETGASSGESDTGTTGPEVQAPPMILGMTLGPGPGTPGSCVLQSAGPVTVTVQVVDAAEVWMTVDDGEAVVLDPVGDEGAEFVGEIAVLGASWNGMHTVSAIAKSGELVSKPWPDMFTVDAPPAGLEVWKKKSAITPSYGNAVAVDAQGDVYELFTESSNQGERCHVRRRDAEGESVWSQDTTPLAVGVHCVGEDIEVDPDGTVWALVNTRQQNVDRWQLFHLAPDGMPLDAPQVSDYEEVGRGLDVNATGDVLLCGVRPGVMSENAWVKLSRPVGTGWTVPWVYKIASTDFVERTRDCAFVEDRIVVVGEVFGYHDENEQSPMSRGFVIEYGVNGVKLPEDVATAFPAWQSSYEAVAPDGDGGYVAVGYTCDAKSVPCTPTKGVVKWFTPGASLAWEQPVAAATRVWDVAASPSGGIVVAAQAVLKEEGFLVQAWALGQGSPSWDYQGTASSIQVATGLTLDLFGYISAGGFYLDGDTLAAGVVRLNPY